MGECVFDTFPAQNGLNQGEVLLPLIFKLPLQYTLGRSKKLWRN
jgi:hypothetical protein